MLYNGTISKVWHWWDKPSRSCYPDLAIRDLGVGNAYAVAPTSASNIGPWAIGMMIPANELDLLRENKRKE